jgi:hypothetical protein
MKPRSRSALRSVLLGGLVAGTIDIGVVPLSAVGHTPHFSVRTFVENILAMLLFGVIINASARETSSRKPPA